MAGAPTEAAAGAGDGAFFGDRAVALRDKQGLVDAVFETVAPNYDLMNDLMSGGLHRLWKRALVDWLTPPQKGERPFRVLDVAGGTGDVAFRIARRSPLAELTVIDINPAMLDVGRERAAAFLLDDQVTFVEGNAEALAAADGSVDAVTMAFGIRNVPRIDRALAEARRVLRPGGRLLVLEFSTVDVAGLERLYEAWSRLAIPRLGRLVAGDAGPYRYLIESIRRFPNQVRFAAMIRAAGFDRVAYRNLTGGIAAIHSGWRL
jgi:demethylmenaquinone methyltransferase/2-methoxy-6-polyprenyl-1,4-benzoquinol methylase